MARTQGRVAVLGIGAMGHGMARSALRAGIPTIVWNRDPEATRDLAELGAEPRVFRNDEVTVEELSAFDGIVISPGPGTPDDAGVSTQAIRELTGKIAILGVCLGHQCLGQAFGGRVVRNEPAHGKTSWIRHDNSGVLAGVTDPFEATRYHSLIVERDSVPEELVVTAWTQDGTVMGLRHARYPTYGVQFHPESVLTKEGKKILGNFVRRSEKKT